MSEKSSAIPCFNQKIKIVKLGRLKKHLGIMYDWKQDKLGNIYLEASMPKMIDEISEKFELARGKKAKEYATPGKPGKTLRKNEGNMVGIDAYRPIVGKLCIKPPRLHSKFAMQ
jgi:hypothetical protein